VKATVPARDVVDGLDDVRAKGVLAFHAKPRSSRDLVEVDALGVVGGVAAVAEQQDLLVPARVAHGAASAGNLWLFGKLLGPFPWIVVGYHGCLLLVLDFSGR
jgi:hypothetical protein